MKLSRFVGGQRSVTSIVNNGTAGSYQLISGVPFAKSLMSGALTAGVLKTILDISGSGVLQFLATQTQTAVARTMRTRVTIDGVVAADATASAFAASGYGQVLVGVCPPSGGYSNGSMGSVPFNASLKVEIASGLTENDSLALMYAYQLT